MYGQPMYGQPMMQQPVIQPVIQQPAPSPVVVVQGQQNRGGSYCPVCNTNTGSKVDFQVGGKTWMWCIILLFFVPGFCWVPFCCDDCKERVVECVTCQARKG